MGLLGQTSTLRSLLEDARKASDQRTALFRRPAALETGRLASEAWKASGVAREYRGANTLLRSDMLKAKTAWLDRSGPARSLKAFADLVGLGRGLRTTSPYDQGLTDALRSSFGDWRDEMSRPMAVMVVPLARTVLYRDLGFDPGLIDFPAPAFDKVLQRHGMGFVDAAWDEDDDGGHGLASCERAARAFVRLRRFEVELRKLIVRAMTNAFGEKWMLWLPPGMADVWRTKR